MEPLDIHEIHETYTRRLKDEDKIIDFITDSEIEAYPNPCYVDQLSGKYVHENRQCPENNSHSRVSSACPFEEYDRCVKVINWIKTLAFFTYYFKDPTAAEGQTLLKGLDQRVYVLSYRQETPTEI
jgi:hypothetical protein